AARPDQARRGGRDLLLPRNADRAPPRVIGDCRGDGQRAPIYPLAQSFRRQFPQVAANAVLRQPQVGGDVLDHDPAVPSKCPEQVIAALRNQHASRSILLLQVSACIVAIMTAQPMLILIAGPYKSGTGGDPDAMAANLRKLEAAAWPIFEAGHIPMIGE